MKRARGPASAIPARTSTAKHAHGSTSTATTLPAKPKHPQIFAGCTLVFWDTAFIGPLIDAVKARGAKIGKDVELGVTTHVIAKDDMCREAALQRLHADNTAEGLPSGIHFVRREFLTQSNIKGQRLNESDFIVAFALPQTEQRASQPSSSSDGLATHDAQAVDSSAGAAAEQQKGPRVVGLKRRRSDSEDEDEILEAAAAAAAATAAATGTREAAEGSPPAETAARTAAASTAAAVRPRALAPGGRPRWGAKHGGLSEPPPAEPRRERKGMAALAPRPLPPGVEPELTHVLSIDCEMVGYGYRGLHSQLAWVAIVNNEGHVLLDTFVAPRHQVTDWRTWVSGVRPSDVEGAPAFEDVRARVASMIAGRVLVGHCISNDFKVLELRHPPELVRDTASYAPLMARRAHNGNRRYGQRLQALVAQELGVNIQEDEHSPVDDARATLYVYHKHQDAWEASLVRQQA